MSDFTRELSKAIAELELQGYDRKEMLEGAKDLLLKEQIKESWRGFHDNCTSVIQK